MPDRLALLGDIHANGPALRAVLAAIADAGLVTGLCTGDLVMRGADPEECVTAVRRLGWPCVMGNTDRKVATRARRDPSTPKAQRVGSRPWSTNQLSAANLAFLEGLPMVVRIRHRGRTIVLMHGSPDDPRQAIDGDTSDRELRRVADALDRPDCIVSGHTHVPLVREAAGCLFVNPGAVGESRDGDLRPSWAWLEVRRSGLRVHLERVAAELATRRG